MYEFSTPEPVQLRIEFGSGDIRIEATEIDRTTVEIRSKRDDESSREAIAETKVEQRGDTIVVESPRRSALFRRGPQLQLRVVVPADSALQAKIESADLTVSGPLAEANVKSGSGDVRLESVSGDTSVQSGSGDVEIASCGRSARLQTGSGDLRIHEAAGNLNTTTGSGDVEIGRVDGTAQINSGSGDVKVQEAGSEVSVNTASGDQYIGRVTRGRVRSNAASGDIYVGVADGTAAWLSVNSLTGSVSSQLDSAEEPAPGEETVELRVNTVSGDIHLSRA